ncbi:GNAT family N-acetyltransferase [Aestuariivirga litoralis]|uniref:GNAT family N-acetyltransferase n=1 Tax=Aestuariivirga litoralis TaxID=2650924 RepID=A0A2W2ANS5_9HYPH|nr:GNAT family N-acetyltransferase [Aestuariivirga litoralis]PZF75232.1 GNAT family N-acetyltransferase [Aestuariivirga litoralis]
MLKAVTSALAIPRADWDRLANPAGAEFNPLVAHDFFRCVEDSGCAAAKTGWAPRHLIMEDDAGQLTGIVPCYRKRHSQGEYVFDYGWADAFERAGGQYYPKMQVSVPFSPVTGPRLMAETEAGRRELASGLIALCTQEEASSVHITFLPERDWEALGGRMWLQRTDIQFHWLNGGYAGFEDFLASLSSAKRKNIRKERASVAKAGITMHALTGKDIAERHWDAFFDFYMDTGARKWGQPYLNRRFFSMIGEAMSEHILLVMAERGGRMIAGALNFIGSHALYGRNWGAIEYHDNLHFETCYYQAIDFAIARRLPRVEAGAQGAHKLARGYLPQKTYSLHYLAHSGLQRAVANYLEAERAGIDQEQQALAAHSPFRQEQDF